MPTRTYTIVVERANDTPEQEYVARALAFDGMDAHGRTEREAINRMKEEIVTACALLSREPDFDGTWPSSLHTRRPHRARRSCRQCGARMEQWLSRY